jgi:hypothetical protein
MTVDGYGNASVQNLAVLGSFTVPNVIGPTGYTGPAGSAGGTGPTGTFLGTYSGTATITGVLSVIGNPTCQLNLGTYVPSNGALYNCTLQAVDDTQYGAHFSINLKTPGSSGMFNPMFTPFYIKSNGYVGIDALCKPLCDRKHGFKR